MDAWFGQVTNFVDLNQDSRFGIALLAAGGWLLLKKACYNPQIYFEASKYWSKKSYDCFKIADRLKKHEIFVSSRVQYRSILNKDE